jgi:hypothetical protein
MSDRRVEAFSQACVFFRGTRARERPATAGGWLLVVAEELLPNGVEREIAAQHPGERRRVAGDV